jgi:hypothetical protein
LTALRERVLVRAAAGPRMTTIRLRLSVPFMAFPREGEALRLALTNNGPASRTQADRLGEVCPAHRLRLAASFGPDLSQALSPPGTLPGAAPTPITTISERRAA